MKGPEFSRSHDSDVDSDGSCCDIAQAGEKTPSLLMDRVRPKTLSGRFTYILVAALELSKMVKSHVNNQNRIRKWLRHR